MSTAAQKMDNSNYQKIRTALCYAGFDDCHQAGSVSRFHKMNIVADSAVLGLRFWFCAGGGYGVPDELYMITRKLGSDGPDERTYFKSQREMEERIESIRQMIKEAAR